MRPTVKAAAGRNRRFLHIARRVSETIGVKFFEMLVTQLAPALDADCVYIGEFTGGQAESVRTLAVCVDHETVENFELPLAGSPDAEVAMGNPCLYSTGVMDLFHADQRLSDLRAQAFVGVPLHDPEGRPAGLIAAVYRSSVVDTIQSVQSTLTMFAGRAAVELNRKHAEDVLRESEQRYRAFIKFNADAMWRIEFEKQISTELSDERQLEDIFRYGYVAECNDALARMLGLERAEQLMGVPVNRLAPHAAETMRQATRALIRSGYRYSTVEVMPVDHAGNRRHMLRSHWGVVTNGILERIWGTHRDLTDLKRSQMELVTAERRLTELLEAVHLITILLDGEGKISFCNHYLETLTGWRAEEIAGQSWVDLMIPADERQKHWVMVVSPSHSAHEPEHFSSMLLTKDGRRRLIEWDTVVMRDAEGHVNGLAIVGRDLTDYKSLEAQFYHAQKLEGIGRLAGAVAHDFNNLLTIIRGYSTQLLETSEQTDSAFISLREIKRAAEKGAVLTNQLLTLSRRQHLQPKLLDLNTVVADDVVMLRRLIREHIELTTDLDPSLGLVCADIDQIHQVILNLVVNARDAMPKGGKLIIALSNVVVGEAHSTGGYEIKPGPYVQLIVADTGVGMTDEVRAHLFEPFFTTKEVGKGTGLGLSTVYGIIHQSGGHIVVESEPLKGTTFQILLPRVEGLPEAAAPVRPVVRGGHETILLVEDQQQVRELLVSLLQRLGYQVFNAETGEKAMQVVQQHGGTLDLLVTDVVMPGMSGHQLANSVRAKHPRVKVLYMSGYDDDTGDIPEALRDPLSAYLQKSFAPETLAVKVREILDRK